jgi:hypothetical protein
MARCICIDCRSERIIVSGPLDERCPDCGSPNVSIFKTIEDYPADDPLWTLLRGDGEAVRAPRVFRQKRRRRG